ncbi:hypothetical protein B0H63DRAFT_535372 [Podospora didyma]|uniref:Uncharacterized protein n=1 Tax=Podospora didyma TaxID=330526 RepID=A0AAE0K019_9PEZI|nr:hypothetical protein B0H63DRAFT_535372 [Podospora didyma]
MPTDAHFNTLFIALFILVSGSNALQLASNTSLFASNTVLSSSYVLLSTGNTSSVMTEGPPKNSPAAAGAVVIEANRMGIPGLSIPDLLSSLFNQPPTSTDTAASASPPTSAVSPGLGDWGALSRSSVPSSTP